MKIYLLSIISCLLASNSIAQQVGILDSAIAIQHLEVACGQCMFGIKDDDCKLAIRINGKAYYVDGADIDGFGDAHKEDGFCNAIREAAVQGNLKRNRFQITYLKLLPLKQ